MYTPVYFIALLAGFVVQYLCDSRCISETASRLPWKVQSIRWSPMARFGPKNGFERCYQVGFEDQHGRKGTRTCRIKGVLGLPMEVEFDPATVNASPPANRRGNQNNA